MGRRAAATIWPVLHCIRYASFRKVFCFAFDVSYVVLIDYYRTRLQLVVVNLNRFFCVPCVCVPFVYTHRFQPTTNQTTHNTTTNHRPCARAAHADPQHSPGGADIWQRNETQNGSHLLLLVPLALPLVNVLTPSLLLLVVRLSIVVYLYLLLILFTFVHIHHHE